MYINIDFVKYKDHEYIVSLGINPKGDDWRTQPYKFSREELKGLRNMVHNLLLDLNRELNYEA